MRPSIFAIAAALMSACASAPARTGPCTGSRVLVVHNNTGSAVDVFAGEKILGEASPGRWEFSLDDVPERSTFRARRDGTWLNGMAANGAAARQVEFSVTCR